ncbi:MAG: DUF2069 domain-containing protein [Methylomonas sp.]|nr:DUF2069 domain-containing protein [Methylomonas sp.]PPD20565.1 MAG: hypothetical protein CTY23_08285 [Methylomonas sp.]PPD26579.1 MAG: hypothetical protein CTY22_04840 [Methylomonas sp.]PPD38374.1 MAG: hypothetical protein CTY21_04835 [Methylomonas sp.]PPD42834.1 MAG: hypothetical protein CTY17_00625 [Methylomonas sp.]
MPRTYYHHIALLGFFGLFFLWMAWPTLLQPPTKLPTALVLLMTVGPLLLPFRGFLDRNLKSCTWMCYLSLPYFVHGVVESYVGGALAHWALLEVGFALMLCFGAGFYVYTAEKSRP